MLDQELAPVLSRNAFGEIQGRSFPDEIVAVSGHVDAWDVGQGEYFSYGMDHYLNKLSYYLN